MHLLFLRFFFIPSQKAKESQIPIWCGTCGLFITALIQISINDSLTRMNGPGGKSAGGSLQPAKFSFPSCKKSYEAGSSSSKKSDWMSHIQSHCKIVDVSTLVTLDNLNQVFNIKFRIMNYMNLRIYCLWFLSVVLAILYWQRSDI